MFTREIVHGTPHEDLGRAVTGYLGYRTFWTGPAQWQLLPRGFVMVLFDLEAPQRWVLRGRYQRCDVVVPVSGLHDRVVRFAQAGWYSGIAACLSPTAAFALLGVEMADFGRRWGDLVDHLGSAVRDLLGRLADAVDWPSRFALLDQFLLRALPARPAVDLAGRAWQRLRSVEGALSVAALAEELSVSTRTLETRFRHEIGVSPKNAARILRFHHAARLLEREDAGLTWIAHECGYTDHAHFAKDVRAMVGCTPTELRSSLRACGFLQARAE